MNGTVSCGIPHGTDELHLFDQVPVQIFQDWWSALDRDLGFILLADIDGSLALMWSWRVVKRLLEDRSLHLITWLRKILLTVVLIMLGIALLNFNNNKNLLATN